MDEQCKARKAEKSERKIRPLFLNVERAYRTHLTLLKVERTRLGSLAEDSAQTGIQQAADTVTSFPGPSLGQYTVHTVLFVRVVTSDSVLDAHTF